LPEGVQKYLDLRLVLWIFIRSSNIIIHIQHYDSRARALFSLQGSKIYICTLGPRTYSKAIPYVKPNKHKILKNAYTMTVLILLSEKNVSVDFICGLQLHANYLI